MIFSEKWLRRIAMTLFIAMANQILSPIGALALTGGPTQPEVQSFEPIGTTEMVDLFSGDFNYNIPLMDVDGYPINISYHSGITMDQEASWVGLGWNINPGVINRNLRGLPDDFAGDLIDKRQYIKPNYTIGVNRALGIEIASLPNLEIGKGIFFNNYKGVGREKFVSASLSAGGKMNMGVSFNNNSQNGLSISPSLGLSAKEKGLESEETYGNLGVSTQMNSRGGRAKLKVEGGFGGNGGVGNSVSIINKANNKARATFGMNYGTDYSFNSFAGVSYSPSFSNSYSNHNYTLSTKLGLESFFINPDVNISGYLALQVASNELVQKKAYGYLYEHQKPSNDILFDVNREKEGAYSLENPILPIPSNTFDLFTISGQGVGGQFRAYQEEITYVTDPEVQTKAYSGSGGLVLGYGPPSETKNGVRVSTNFTRSKSGVWDGSIFYSVNEGRSKSPKPSNYKPVQFRTIGEKVEVNTDYLPYMNLGEVLAPEIDPFGLSVADDFPRKPITNLRYNSANFSNNVLKPQTQHIKYLTVKDRKYCLTENIISYPLYNANPGNSEPISTTVSRIDNNRAEHHITEMSLTQSDGRKYVYGIAAYNNKTEEYSFAIPKERIGSENSQVHVQDVKTNYIDQHKGAHGAGYDGYFNYVGNPAYAHSFLLTNVLSADYVDVDGNGPSTNDLGNYTNINYGRQYGNNGIGDDSYEWRLPYREDYCSFSNGSRLDELDNKASISKGSKEIWYVSNIESKNYIAVFYFDQRKDSKSYAANVSNAKPLLSLKRISLYTQADWKVKQHDATPIKSVHFEYDYSLCRNVENNEYFNQSTHYAESGKLTLRKLYFTYGKSNKGKFSPYKFFYQEDYNESTKVYDFREGVNPDYNLAHYDRWGCFKPSPANGLLNNEFPYTPQNSATNIYAAAWTMDKIMLPTGGTIQIEYEADDYAYVQNKRAMEMMNLAGFAHYKDKDASNKNADVNISAIESKLYEFGLTSKYANNIACIKLPNEMSEDYFKTEYVGGIDKMFFNILMNFGSGSTTKNEFVRGYVPIDPSTCFVLSRNGEKYGMIPLQGESLRDASLFNETNPFAYAGWQFARLNAPFLVYPGSDIYKGGAVDESGNNWGVVKQVMSALIAGSSDVNDVIFGLNTRLRKQGFCKNVAVDKSWIRLNQPEKKKLGGGARVKRIRLNDNWNKMSNESAESAEYGQQYDYTIEEKIGSAYRKISSGVASYEPMAGNEENPWRQPIAYNQSNLLVPDNRFYTETPFGESFFPAPSVGYSRVTVKNLSTPNSDSRSAGRTVNEFYTTKDFPTIVKYTKPKSVTQGPDIMMKLLAFQSESEVAVGQGFQIELNDMNGKLKATWEYALAEWDAQQQGLVSKLISGSEYFYKTDEHDIAHLNNNVKVISKNGEIKEALVGVDADLTIDLRKSTNKTYSGGVNVNVETTLIPPAVLLTIFPNYNYSYDGFHSASFCRVINRYGILEKTVVHVDGSSSAQANLVWDAKTGDVLISKVENEFKDQVFQTNYPAHWAYDNMGQVYQNHGLKFASVTVSNGIIQLPNGLNPKNYFVEDDILKCVSAGSEFSAIVKLTGGVLYLYHVTDGTPVNVSPISVEVLQSGRKNMAGQAIFSITTLADPIDWSGVIPSLKINPGPGTLNQTSIADRLKVINASAVYFGKVETKPCTYCENRSYEFIDGNDSYYRSLVDILVGAFTPFDINRYVTPQYTTVPINTNATYYQNSWLKQLRDANGTAHFYQYKYDIIEQSNGRFQVFLKFKFPTELNGNGPTLNFSLLDFIGGSNYGLMSMSKTAILNLSPQSLSSVSSGLVLEIKDLSTNYISIFNGTCGPYSCSGHGLTIDINPSYHNSIRSSIISGNLAFQNNMNKVLPSPLIPISSYVYKTNRRTDNATKQNIRKDGYYTDFYPYWSYSNYKWDTLNPIDLMKWKWTSKVTAIDQYSGIPTEEVNALGIPTAMKINHGELNNLPIFTVSNGSLNQTITFNFEEQYQLLDPGKYHNEYGFNMEQCKSDNLYLRNESSSFSTAVKEIDPTIAHTGKNSVKIGQNGEVWNAFWVHQETTGDLVKQKDCLMPFSPSPGKYIVSGWVKNNKPLVDISDRFGKCEVKFYQNNVALTTTYQFAPTGVIIEGWQRFEGIITVPEDIDYMRFSLLGSPTLGTFTWYDDIRISPFNSSVKSYVYSIANRKLAAILDENNFASMYEYDEQGALMRVKRETEDGIVTVSESRNFTSQIIK